MSSVRMCDNPNCQELFSELEEGWGTGQQVQYVTDEQGNRKSVVVTLDTCPECTGDAKAVAGKLAQVRKERRRERLELESGKGSRNVRKGRGSHDWEDEIPE